MAKSLSLAEETPALVRSSSNQLEKFLLRRAIKMVADEPDRNYCLLLGYELLYLWNALGACLKHSHASIQIGELFLLLRNINNASIVKIYFNIPISKLLEHDFVILIPRPLFIIQISCPRFMIRFQECKLSRPLVWPPLKDFSLGILISQSWFYNPTIYFYIPSFVDAI